MQIPCPKTTLTQTSLSQTQTQGPKLHKIHPEQPTVSKSQQDGRLAPLGTPVIEEAKASKNRCSQLIREIQKRFENIRKKSDSVLLRGKKVYWI
jgi:hypothetical protein